MLAPGELITATAIEALREVRAADGGRIAYAADPTLASFQVVRADADGRGGGTGAAGR